MNQYDLTLSTDVREITKVASFVQVQTDLGKILSQFGEAFELEIFRTRVLDLTKTFGVQSPRF